MYDLTLIRKVSQALSSPQGCRFMNRIGYKNSAPIIAADFNERLVDVFSRVEATDSDIAYIAVLFENRGVISVMPISRTQSEDACDTLKTDTDSQSTIGMLVEDMRHRDAKVRIVIEVAHSLRHVKVSEYDPALVAA